MNLNNFPLHFPPFNPSHAWQFVAHDVPETRMMVPPPVWQQSPCDKDQETDLVGKTKRQGTALRTWLCAYAVYHYWLPPFRQVKLWIREDCCSCECVCVYEGILSWCFSYGKLGKISFIYLSDWTHHLDAFYLFLSPNILQGLLEIHPQPPNM